MQKCSTKVPSVLFYVLWWNLLKKTEQNSDFALFPILDPKARLRFEIFFKKTHPRINLITLFLTKIYLLNTLLVLFAKCLINLEKQKHSSRWNFTVLPRFLIYFFGHVPKIWYDHLVLTAVREFTHVRRHSLLKKSFYIYVFMIFIPFSFLRGSKNCNPNILVWQFMTL
jgi:hypothetical protein